MLWSSLLVVSSFVVGGFAAPASHVLHEKRAVPLQHERRRVEAQALIPVRIGLKQCNLETGHDRLMEVSHPSSPNYGKHLTAAEVHDIFAPSEESTNAVKNWLIGAGIDASAIVEYTNKGWLAIDMPAHQAEQLLHTEYYESDHADGVRIGNDGYYLPIEVTQHVDFIKPGVKLSAPLKKRVVERDSLAAPARTRKPPHMKPHHYPGWTVPHGGSTLPPDLQGCGVNITPVCLQALYGLPKSPNFHDSKNQMGLFEDYDAYAQSDLNEFWAHFAPWVPQGTGPKVISVDGGTSDVAASDERNGGESDIDIQLSQSLIYPQKVIVYQVDDLYESENADGFLNTFLDSIDGSYCSYTAFGITGDSPDIDANYPDPNGYKGKLECGVYELTPVVSISYGYAELSYPKPYVERQCNEIMKLGLQGHSILVAAGDYGVASFPGLDSEYGCLSGEGQNATIYNPDYPAGCPYITVVGGTQLYTNQTVLDPESAMQVNLTAYNIEFGEGSTDEPPLDFFASGGGFSNYFAPASYQQATISEYFKTHKPSVPSYIANSGATNVGAGGGVYNRAGRGYPDVAANGAFALTYINGTQGAIFGTSLSSPIFGSILTLLNEERTAHGKSSIGFVNPVLYEHPEVMNDITNGSNPNCGSAGFKAVKGWDPVTGLGTANYPKMLDLFLSLP